MTQGEEPAVPDDATSTLDTSKPRRKGSVAPRSFRGRLIAGVLLIIPLAVTGILMRYVYGAALSVGASVVNWIYWGALWTQGERPGQESGVGVRPEVLINPADPDWMDIMMAIGLTIVILYFLGWLGTNVVGRRFIEVLESLVEKIPFVDTIYGSIKRMVQALSGVRDPEEGEKRVVLIGFPDAHLWAIGFMTNQIVDRNSGRQYATVYVPTTPNPTSGYMEIVPIERITETDLTMEQALSMILSGGATAPSEMHLSQQIPPGPATGSSE
ncbi:MAG: DUF502 domain-containing protein [Phycisphaerae bacterium]